MNNIVLEERTVIDLFTATRTCAASLNHSVVDCFDKETQKLKFHRTDHSNLMFSLFLVLLKQTALTPNFISKSVSASHSCKNCYSLNRTIYNFDKYLLRFQLPAMLTVRISWEITAVATKSRSLKIQIVMCCLIK